MRLVSSFLSSGSASVVSATGASSAVSVAHAAGNFGSVTVRVSCARQRRRERASRASSQARETRSIVLATSTAERHGFGAERDRRFDRRAESLRPLIEIRPPVAHVAEIAARRPPGADLIAHRLARASRVRRPGNDRSSPSNRRPTSRGMKNADAHVTMPAALRKKRSPLRQPRPRTRLALRSDDARPLHDARRPRDVARRAALRAEDARDVIEVVAGVDRDAL